MTGTRSGLSYWLRGYTTMLRFDAASLRVWLPLFLVVQVFVSLGTAIMYGFYYGEIPPETAVFIATGIPALALIPVGFIAVPNIIGEEKTARTFEFTWSLPVPRLAAAAAAFTLFTALAIPGAILALAVTALRYDVSLDVSPLVVPALLLTGLMAASVGAAMAYLIPSPVVTNLITNVLLFFVLLFCPITFPATQYPDWLVALNRGLPFYHMAVVIRDSLSDGLVTNAGASWAVLAGWTAAGWAATAWVVGRRG